MNDYPELSTDARDLLMDVENFCEKEVRQQAIDADKSDGDITSIIEKAEEMGFTSLEVPEQYGGPGLSKYDSLALLEKMAYYDAGFGITVSANGLAAAPVVLAGSEEQKARMYEIILNGGIGAFCLSEPDAGCDASAAKSVAVRDGSDYVINGTKCFITNGPNATFYVVFAMTDKSLGAGKGYSAFFIEKKAPGLSIGKHEDKMGIRCSQTSEVILTNVRVPESARIGAEGAGFKIAMKSLDIARISCGITAVGICQRAIDEARDYSKKRVQFGATLSRNEVIQFKLADMYMKTQAARQLCIHAAKLLMQGMPFSCEAAAAKCTAGDAAMEVTIEAVQILGGYGYMRDYPVEKLMRDAKIFQIFEGTNEIQRMVIGRSVIGR